MTQYSGTKSLDAEITIDFDEGEIQMDYSLNSLGSPYNSNSSVKLFSEYLDQPYFVRLKFAFFQTLAEFCMLFMGFYTAIVTFLFLHKVIINPKWQYKHQKFLRWYLIILYGEFEETISGKTDKTSVSFRVPANIGIDYYLTGDYKEQVKTIALKRFFAKKRRYGKFNEIRQHGWVMIFTFRHPPQNGSCIVRYVG